LASLPKKSPSEEGPPVAFSLRNLALAVRFSRWRGLLLRTLMKKIVVIATLVAAFATPALAADFYIAYIAADLASGKCMG
jgi:hypothetical protein